MQAQLKDRAVPQRWLHTQCPTAIKCSPSQSVWVAKLKIATLTLLSWHFFSEDEEAKSEGTSLPNVPLSPLSMEPLTGDNWHTGIRWQVTGNSITYEVRRGSPGNQKSKGIPKISSLQSHTASWEKGQRVSNLGYMLDPCSPQRLLVNTYSGQRDLEFSVDQLHHDAC